MTAAPSGIPFTFSNQGLGNPAPPPGVVSTPISELDLNFLSLADGYVSVRGALSTTDASFNVRLIQGLLNQGFYVVLPSDGQVYPINQTLVIGNGFAAAPSTIGGGLIGQAGAVSYGALSCYLEWTGPVSPTNPFVLVAGMMYGARVVGVGLNCNFACAGILVNGMRASAIEFNDIAAAIGYGVKIIGNSAAPGGQIIQNRIAFNLCETGGDQADHPVDGYKGLWLDGFITDTNDEWLNIFEGNRWSIVGATNSSAGYFAFCDSNLILRDHFVTALTPGAGSHGITFDATNNDGFPAGMHFVSISCFPDTQVIETSGAHIRANYFSAFGTYDNEAVPTHPKLIGFTDQGLTFNGGIQPLSADIREAAWPAGALTVSDNGGHTTAATTAIHYTKIGRLVHFRISLMLTVVDGSATALILTGLPFTTAGQCAPVAVNDSTDAVYYAALTPGPTQITIRTTSMGFPGVVGNGLTISGFYEATS